MKTVIFLDDFRKPEQCFDTSQCMVFCAATFDEFVEVLNKTYLEYKRVDEIWFDHDLGENAGTGYDCAKYLVEFCIEHNMDLPEYYIQSNNPAGKLNIDSYLKSFLKSQNI